MDSECQQPSFVAPTLEELAPLFPSYEMVDFIAAGGMGAVYQASQRSLDRAVAIKILPREFGADATFRAGFEAEAKAMARLNHPNLIAVYDFGEIDGMLFIVMEMVPGKSIHHSAHGVAIEQLEAARVVTGICRGLAHAHQAGILHRDIKPANILLTSTAQPKIGDFGLARPVGHTDGEDEVIFGTPGYSAPEVLNHPEAVGARTDIYAVGVILYELLTGQLPGEQWQAPSTLARVDPGFDAIVRRATHPSPELRYADANELGDELEQLARRLEGNVLRRTVAAPAAVRQTPAVPGPLRTGPRKLASSNSSSNAPVVAMVVVVFGLLGVLALVMLGGGGDPPVATAQPAPVIAPEPSEPPASSPEPELVEAPVDPEPVPEPVSIPTDPEPPQVPAEEVAQVDPVMPEETPLDPEPEVAPEPTIPEFDTAAFIDTGRLALQQKAAPMFVALEEEHTKSLARFERSAERLARRLNDELRDLAEEYVENYFTGVRETNRLTALPGELPRGIGRVGPDFRKEHAEAAERQLEIDADFADSLEPLRDLYATGLKRKAAELRELGDTDAEAILAEEADRAMDSLPRFIAILKNEDPDSVVAEAADGN